VRQRRYSVPITFDVNPANTGHHSTIFGILPSAREQRPKQKHERDKLKQVTQPQKEQKQKQEQNKGLPNSYITPFQKATTITSSVTPSKITAVQNQEQEQELRRKQTQYKKRQNPSDYSQPHVLNSKNKEKTFTDEYGVTLQTDEKTPQNVTTLFSLQKENKGILLFFLRSSLIRFLELTIQEQELYSLLLSIQMEQHFETFGKADYDVNILLKLNG